MTRNIDCYRMGAGPQVFEVKGFAKEYMPSEGLHVGDLRWEVYFMLRQ